MIKRNAIWAAKFFTESKQGIFKSANDCIYFIILVTIHSQYKGLITSDAMKDANKISCNLSAIPFRNTTIKDHFKNSPKSLFDDHIGVGVALEGAGNDDGVGIKIPPTGLI